VAGHDLTCSSTPVCSRRALARGCHVPVAGHCPVELRLSFQPAQLDMRLAQRGCLCSSSILTHGWRLPLRKCGSAVWRASAWAGGGEARLVASLGPMSGVTRASRVSGRLAARIALLRPCGPDAHARAGGERQPRAPRRAIRAARAPALPGLPGHRAHAGRCGAWLEFHACASTCKQGFLGCSFAPRRKACSGDSGREVCLLQPGQGGTFPAACMAASAARSQRASQPHQRLLRPGRPPRVPTDRAEGAAQATRPVHLAAAWAPRRRRPPLRLRAGSPGTAWTRARPLRPSSCAWRTAPAWCGARATACSRRGVLQAGLHSCR